MPRFRNRTGVDSLTRLDPRSLFDDLLRPCHFYVGPKLPPTWRTAFDETIAWETFQGRLLGARQTRASRSFRSWSLLDASASAAAPRPMVSLKWDTERGEIHVVRGMLCHVWESYDAGGNVIESREAAQWVLELVGSLQLAEFTDGGELRDELICRLWQAVVGTSRLPLSSLEAPLPAFALGQLAYVYRPGAAGDAPMRDWRELIEQGWLPELNPRERVKLLEAVLRAAAPPEIPEVAARMIHKSDDLQHVLRAMFNDVSLSPWTGFVDNALAFVHALAELGHLVPEDEATFLSWLLNKLSRHLTAYDLVKFHHRGANYPDALLMDAALKRLLQAAERNPKSFLDDACLESTRSPAPLRLGLLHGALLRRIYEGHAVPDAPTSPGENARVLPAPFERVPEAQLTNPLQRGRRLFAGDPLSALWTPATKEILQRSLHDLSEFREVVELGKAVFIDRPLGFGKAPLEPDQTPLLAHEAYSQAIARRRLDLLGELARATGLTLPENWEQSRQALVQSSWVDGVPIARCASLGRPVAALADAQLVSDDFVVVRTLPASMGQMRENFAWDTLLRRFRLEGIWQSERPLCLRIVTGKSSAMAICDGSLDGVRSRVLFEADSAAGFRSRGGVELPAAGLRIWEVRDDDGGIHDLRRDTVHVLPR